MKLVSFKSNRKKKTIAVFLMSVMVLELLTPLRAAALTSGPSQPEFQGFSPLATTSLVDPFTGDFSYNIPLLDIEGYPINLIYRATSNVEEEASWVGYGWNVNIGTLNRLVRGLPDDMNGAMIKSYQNIRERRIESNSIILDARLGAHATLDGTGIGANAGVMGSMGFSIDEDDYTGVGVGISIGGGVYAGAFAGGSGGVFSANGNAGVTLSVSSNNGGGLSTYAGFNAGFALNEGVSVGFGQSVTRSYNTISGWEKPNIMGTYNIGHVTREIQRNYVGSISNAIPVVTNPYFCHSDGIGYKLSLGVSMDIMEGLGLDLGIGLSYIKNISTTSFNNINNYKGYGYMYSENALSTDILDFSRDNDGNLNKDIPFLPPAIKTYDIFSSTAHNATSAFRADRNDFGTVRDPRIAFQSASGGNERHEINVKFIGQALPPCVGAGGGYYNIQNHSETRVFSGGCVSDSVPYRYSNGRDQNLFFRPCGYVSRSDKGGQKRMVNREPIQVYTNQMIADFPRTVISPKLKSYAKGIFPTNLCPITEIERGDNSDAINNSKIGAILNTNSNGQIFVYATPVTNNIKNEVAFRANGFDENSIDRVNGILTFGNKDATQSTEIKRDKLYKTTTTPSYNTSYLLNAVLSPDYVDVENNGVTDDDLGGFVKFNYSRTNDDYRWRTPYADKGERKALFNEGVKLTKFDDMGSYVAGSKETWYAHSIESKNYVAEFYLSERADAKDSRGYIMPSDHPYADSRYMDDKNDYSKTVRLDSIKYYSKHDRYLNADNAIPLKSIYFTYDYGISSGLPNADNLGGKLRLLKVQVRHADEPIEFAETYNLDYSLSNPAYALGAKDGWGNYAPNNRSIPLCEFPYIDQKSRESANEVASAFHLTQIGLPSGGRIKIAYEADDYAYVQDRRAMALTQVEGIGSSNSFVPTDVDGLYNGGLNAYRYIYVAKPAGFSGSDYGSLLNYSDLMYFSFNINIGGRAFSTFDQVKGYAQVEEMGECPNQTDYLYIKVKTVPLTKTNVSPSPMTNTAINMARAYASDQLYYQEQEISSGLNRNQGARLAKAATQLADALFGKNNIATLMSSDYRAGKYFNKNKSYVRLALAQPKIGGGSRVSELTFDDEWNKMVAEEDSSLIGYHYAYKDENGLSSGVASYEPTVGGEENPFRSGTSYKLSNNQSTYPPYDPVEMVKEDPAGESFLPTGSVGYGRVVIESIHKGYARSAQSQIIQEFYTAKDFPFFSSYSPKSVNENQDAKYPNPALRDIVLSMMGNFDFSTTISSSQNNYAVKQSFVIETNNMHGKPKKTSNYRLLQKNGRVELISSKEYFYHTNGNNKLSNEVEIFQHVASPRSKYPYPEIWDMEKSFPKDNIQISRTTLGVEEDVCTDSRESVTVEDRNATKVGGGIDVCFPLWFDIAANDADNIHKHTDYFKATITTKLVNRCGIIKEVRSYDEGAETIVQNKYYDAITGEAVVQIVKDKYGDDLYKTDIPAYWTNTHLEPSYLEYPYAGFGSEKLLPSPLTFTNSNGNAANSYAGYLWGSQVLNTSFTTEENLFHPGDELFVYANSNRDANQKWYRLYVGDVTSWKTHPSDPDPLAWRYGTNTSTGSSFQVTLIPYKIGNLNSQDIQAGDQIQNIGYVFKYRSGRKNILTSSAGDVSSFENPLLSRDSAASGEISVVDNSLIYGRGKPGGCILRYLDTNFEVPNFLKPVINASASCYADRTAMLNGDINSLLFNPISLGIINQPYVISVCALLGSRQDPSNTMLQRGNGILPNWYYWLPARIDSTWDYQPLKPLLAHYGDSIFNPVANTVGNASWFTASNVTKAIPSLGPVEETNPLGIFSSVFMEPITKNVQYVATNAKFGQTWVESFEDYQRARKYNEITDLMFSPFYNTMTKIALGGDYKVYDTEQSLSGAIVNGSFTMDDDQAHTGVFSLKANSQVSVSVTPKKYTTLKSYFSNLFDFNLDDVANQMYTCEVWVKNNQGGGPSAPIVAGAMLQKVTPSIDGWTLYRTNLSVNDGVGVSLVLPSGQSYDDLRIFPVGANVKSYVYHPFKNYLMAVLDENNTATFYEYNMRSQLVRLKKETEKGIITINENIKNVVRK